MIPWIKKAFLMFSAYLNGLHSTVGVNPQVGAEEITQKYDYLFAKYGGEIPVPFLRALAYSESGMKPDSELRKGFDPKTRRYTKGKRKGKYDRYWGLLQVDSYQDELDSFNRRHGTNFAREHLFDAETNIRIGLDKLHRILRAYKQWSRKHDISNLWPSWSNPEFVKLFTAGWNSGYSRSAGVQYMAAWLAKRDIPVTHDNVFKYGERAGASRFVTTAFDKKRKWQQGVARRYFRQARIKPKLISKGTGAGGIILAAVIAIPAAILIAKG
jgi:hypothetical protein